MNQAAQHTGLRHLNSEILKQIQKVQFDVKYTTNIQKNWEKSPQLSKSLPNFYYIYFPLNCAGIDWLNVEPQF